ncbi:MAG: nicotinate-nicotinamide nucleotide adenylyltransferase, partial [Vicinamibacteria bacterium]
TIDTLERLEADSKSDRFFFITGTDAFAEIQTWKSWRELLSRHSFVVHERPGFPIGEAREVLPGGARSRVLGESVEGEPEWGDAGVWFVRRPMLDISSTEIRRSVRENRSIRFLVPDTVEAYIRESRLYR